MEAYLAGFGLIMATGGFLWLAQGSAAVARAAGVMQRNDGIQHEEGVVCESDQKLISGCALYIPGETAAESPVTHTFYYVEVCDYEGDLEGTRA